MNGRLGDERGSVLVTTLLTAVILLALGLALLSIVDTQGRASATERTRDRGLNLSEGVLTSEAFVLANNWPASAVTSGTGTIQSPLEANCGLAVTPVQGLRDAATAGTRQALVAPNLRGAYQGDAGYDGATWQFTVCDDDAVHTAWDEATLTNGTKNWDKNANNLVWVRAQAVVGGRKRAVAGLVKVRSGPALLSKYGLVAGNVAEDVPATISTITNASVLSGVTGKLLTTNPLVAEDPTLNTNGTKKYPVPNSGVIGLRCGLLDKINVAKTCVTGTIGALNSVALVDALVAKGTVTQYPSYSSTDPRTVGQLRAQAKAAGTYSPSSPGADTAAGAPPCTITGSPTSDTVVFVEKVGTGDQYCSIDVSTLSRTYKALVIGSGRVVIRGDNNVNGPTAYSTTVAKNLLTGPVYALNLQTSDLSQATPTRELVRIEKGAWVRGAVHADGKNATVSVTPPDPNTNTLVCALVSCPSLLATTLQALGVTDLVNTLINGGCLLRALGVCTLYLPPTPASDVVAALQAQLTSYGAGIRSDVGIVDRLTVYGSSAVIPGTFSDLQPSR